MQLDVVLGRGRRRVALGGGFLVRRRQVWGLLEDAGAAVRAEGGALLDDLVERGTVL